MKPYISVIVIAHDRRRYLLEALKSIKKQTLLKDLYEVVIVKNFEDSEIDTYARSMQATLIFTKEENAGAKVSTGIKLSKGEIICMMADDDLYLPDKLRSVYDNFNRDPQLIYYHNAFATIDEQGHRRRFKHYKNPLHRLTTLNNPVGVNGLAKMIKFMGYHNDSSISIRKEYFCEYLDILAQFQVSWDSFFFFLSFKSHSHIVIDSKILTLFRVHNSLSHTKEDFELFLDKRCVLSKRFIKESYLISKITNEPSVINYLSYIVASWYIVQYLVCRNANKLILIGKLGTISRNIKYSLPAGRLATLLGGILCVFANGFASTVYYLYNKLLYF